ncbi:MAG: hypothetical protein HY851_08600 [candidate division Zixibacteria bacterium]|nr:hypothetical protein [candidate division Zixibacteria bacterium]
MSRSPSLGWLLVAAVFLTMAGRIDAANHRIDVDDFTFSPLKTHVAPGDSVIWIWIGAFSHSSTSDPSSAKVWNSGLKTTGRFGIKITAADGPGPFPYHCSLHVGMKDTIYVDTPPPCCQGTTGNIDCDPANNVDISDLSRLIDNLFISFVPLCCDAAANVDGVTGVDISDLSVLIDNLFISFKPLAPCQ